MILTEQILKGKGAGEGVILFFKTNNLENKSIISVFDYCISKKWVYPIWLFKYFKEFATTERLIEFYNCLRGKEWFDTATWLLADFKDNKEFATTERLIEFYNCLGKENLLYNTGYLLINFKDNEEFINAVKDK